MDNEQQIKEIKKFHSYLASQGENIDENKAALLWIEQNARKWRVEHNLELKNEHRN